VSSPLRGRPTTKSRGLNDLLFFAKEICGFKEMSEVLHRELADLIEKAILSNQNQGVIIPRDMFKTSLGLAAVLWAFTRKAVIEGNRDYRVLIDSATMSLSNKSLRWIARTLESNKEYRACYGDFFKGSRCSSREIYVGGREVSVVKEPNFMASSVRSEIVGLHFDLYWPDDLVTERTYSTPHLRNAVTQHFFSNLNLLEPGASIFYTATTWHDGDLTGHLRRMEKEALAKGEKPFCKMYVRAAMEDDNRCADDVNGHSIFPERWTTEALLAKRAALPRPNWRAQHMNDPSLPEYAIQFRKDEMYVPRATFPDRLRLKVMTVDPNFREENQVGNDYGCIVVGGFDSKANWWGIDVRMDRWTSDQFLDQLFECHRMWRPHIIRIEQKFTSHLMSAIRHRESILGVHLPIQPMKRDWRSKEMRYVGMGPIFSAGRIHFASEIERRVKTEMEDELERVGSSAHDDFLDAMMDQVTDLYPAMSLDAGSATFFGDEPSPMKRTNNPYDAYQARMVAPYNDFPEEEQEGDIN
jgi:hypothetical protein